MFRFNLAREPWIVYDSELYALAVSESWICGTPEIDITQGISHG